MILDSSHEETGANDRPGAGLQAHLLQFTGQKAGMSQVDTDKVHQIIYEASKDSAYYRNQQRQAERVSKQLEKIKSKIDAISEQEKHQATAEAQRDAERLRQEMRLDRTWVCIDLDMFYAAVAIRDNPELQDKPVAVGDMQMISTASYVARKYGVRSAMPGFIAVRLCPDLVFVKHDFATYQAEATKFRAIFADYDPQFTSWSLDEAVLDVTDYIRSHGDRITGEDVAKEIRRRIFETTKLSASCGVACNQMLAKICSDINKPNGQYCLASDRQAIEMFMKDLPPRKIPGIGRVTERILKEIGVEKCDDFIKQVAIAKQVFSPRTVQWLLRVTLGLGRSQRSESDLEFQPRKSYSVSRTFSSLHRPQDLELKLKEVAQKLVRDTQEYPGKTLTLIVKSVDFRVTSKAVTIPMYISTLDDIVHHGTILLRSLFPLQLRLMGLRLSALAPEGSRDIALRQQTMDRFVKKGSDDLQPNTDSMENNEDPSDLDPFESDCGDIEIDPEFGDAVDADTDDSMEPSHIPQANTGGDDLRRSESEPMPNIKPLTYAAALRQRNQIPILNASRLLNRFSD